MNISDLDNLPEGGTETAQTSDNDTGFNWDYHDPDDDQDNEETPVESATENEESEQEETAEADEEQQEDAEDGESEAEEAEETAEEVEPDVEVTLTDGQKVSLQELKDGYLRQSDYSRKTEQAAQIRKEYEGKEQQLSQGAQKVIHSFEVIDEFMRSEIPAPPSPELAQTDFVAYVQEKAIYDHAMNRMGKLQEAMNAPRQVMETMDQQKLEGIRDAENRKLAEYFPEMAVPEKREKLRKTIETAASEVGISVDELRGIADHRFFRLAHLAAKGLEAEKARAKARKKSEKAPPVAAPRAQKSANVGKNRDAMKRLAQSGSIHDALMIDFD